MWYFYKEKISLLLIFRNTKKKISVVSVDNYLFLFFLVRISANGGMWIRIARVTALFTWKVETFSGRNWIYCYHVFIYVVSFISFVVFLNFKDAMFPISLALRWRLFLFYLSISISSFSFLYPITEKSIE